MNFPLHVTHAEKCASSPAHSLTDIAPPTPKQIAQLRAALDHFNATHIDIIITDRARRMRAFHHAKPQ